MSSVADQLTPGDWAVLAIVAEGPTHGFAAARLLAPDGEVGRVWGVRRPLVYRTVEILTGHGLIEGRGTEASDSGPPRTVIATTAKGRRLVRGWLAAPISRVRDARSLLMLKLLFHDRSGSDPTPLLEAQARVLAERCEELAQEADAAEGFDRTLAIWRLESSRAAERFCHELLDAVVET